MPPFPSGRSAVTRVFDDDDFDWWLWPALLIGLCITALIALGTFVHWLRS